MNTIENQINENMLVAQGIFNAQINNARDYMRQEKELGFLTEKGVAVFLVLPSENTLKIMEQHSFVLWLRTQPGFIEATKKLSKHNPSVIKRSSVGVIDKYVTQFTLERLCAHHVCLFTDRGSVLEQAVVHQEDRDTAVAAGQALLTIFNKGSLYFEDGAKQLIVQILLKDLLKKHNDNVFSSKKRHPSLPRQVLTKFIAQALFRTYEKIATGLVVNVALDLSNIFFRDVMDKRNAEKMIREISLLVDEENEFLKKTMMELLCE
jgi:hypothetical protein